MFIAGRLLTRACGGSAERAEYGCAGRGHFRKGRGAGAAGPTSAKLLKTVAEADIANLKYFRVTRGKIAGVPVDISRTGTPGSGYEIWCH